MNSPATILRICRSPSAIQGFGRPTDASNGRPRNRQPAAPRSRTVRAAVPNAAPRQRLDATRRPWAAIVLFLAPALALYCAFVIVPVLMTFYNSVHRLEIYG